MQPDLDVLADPTRRLMLAVLSAEREVCVCEFVAALDDVQPRVSRQLALLRDAGWLAVRREGTWMHYRLAPLPDWAQALVAALVAGGVPKTALRTARTRLRNFSGGPLRAPGTAA